MMMMMFYEFELVHNTKEVTKNFSCAKGEGVVDHSTVTRWFKKFHSSGKNIDNQARSGSPKTMDSETMLLAIEANLVSSTQSVLRKLNIWRSRVFYHFHNLGKSIQSCWIVPHVTKIFKNFQPGVTKLFSTRATSNILEIFVCERVNTRLTVEINLKHVSSNVLLEEHLMSWLLSKEMDSVTHVQILHEVVCISLHANAFKKSMNQSILPLAMGKS